MLLPADNKYDNRDVILEVESGAGGAEAMIFAFELLTMYQKYAAYKGWDWGIISMEKGGTGGNYQRMKAMGIWCLVLWKIHHHCIGHKTTSSIFTTQSYTAHFYAIGFIFWLQFTPLLDVTMVEHHCN